MEEKHYAARAQLLALQREHPDWTHQQMAEATGYSRDWVRKWRRRFRFVAQPEHILRGWPRTPRRHAEPLSAAVIQRILDIRDHPPENLQRVPGPKAILYYLQRDEALKARGLRLPKSTKTVWKILDQHGRIWRKAKVAHQPVERAEPMQSWAIDFKDVSSVQPDPDGEGKIQHVAETLDVVDEGTSILLDNPVRGDFTSETTLQALANTLATHGVPDKITCDRDPRFVGSVTSRDFPSAFIRFLSCLGIKVNICPPHRPDKNPFVERLHGTYERECLQRQRPTDLLQAEEVSAAFKTHYNGERPNQALSCGNRPPLVAFPSLPSRPALPTLVDPDRWLDQVDNQAFVRKVRKDGRVCVDGHFYYISLALRGQHVVLQVNAQQRMLNVSHDNQVLKTLPIKGLLNNPMPFADYLDLMGKQARTERSARYRAAT